MPSRRNVATPMSGRGLGGDLLMLNVKIIWNE